MRQYFDVSGSAGGPSLLYVVPLLRFQGATRIRPQGWPLLLKGGLRRRRFIAIDEGARLR